MFNMVYFFEYFFEIFDHYIRRKGLGLSGFAVDTFHLAENTPLLPVTCL
jgi:hypothetical protein